MKKRGFGVLLLSLAASCTLHPRYERPELPMPETWNTSLSSENAIDIDWWRQFGDPVLCQLVEEALLGNQDLQVAIARVEQFQAQLGIDRSKLFPQLELNPALASREKISDSITALPPGVEQVFNTFGFLFKASYFVDLWGEVRSGVESGYHAWLASIESRRAAVLTLVSAVASSYIYLRQCDQQLAISREILEAREQSLFLAKIRFELGLTSQMPVEQAVSEVESAEAEVELLKIAIAQTENLLSSLLGKTSGTIERGLPLDQFAILAEVPLYLPSEIVCKRPDIRAAEEKLIAAGARIGVARAKFFPQVSLSGIFGYESVQFSSLLTNPSKIWEYGATLLQEIFTGGKLTNNVKLAEALQKEALHVYLSTLVTAFKEVSDALATHSLDLERVETERLRVNALENYLHLAKLRYDEGQTDYLTFLDAERQLFRGLLAYEQAKGKSFLSLVQIYQALGGSWVLEADARALSEE